MTTPGVFVAVISEKKNSAFKPYAIDLPPGIIAAFLGSFGTGNSTLVN